MKKLFILLVVMFSFSSLKAQTTSVSMTVVDPSTQVWANGFITYTFSPAPGYPGPYQWQGANLPSIYLTPQTATLNGSGVTTISIPDNNTITPANSSWAFVVCSNTSFQCASIKIPVSGASEDISSIINAALVAINLPATTFPRAYTTTEITLNPQQGGLFYNATLQCLEFWNGTVWGCLAQGSTPFFQVNGVYLSTQDLINYESTNSSLTLSNPSAGNVNLEINPTLQATFCLENGTNCGTITINNITCDIAGSCTLPITGTTTINGTVCALNGSCTIVSSGTTTINTIPCALGGSCTVPTGINTPRVCNADGCFVIFSDGTVEEWGTVTAAPAGGTVQTVPIVFPYTFPTSTTLTVSAGSVPDGTNNDSLSVYYINKSLTGATVVLRCASNIGGTGCPNISNSVPVDWHAIGY